MYSYTAALAVCSRRGAWMPALKLLDRMRARGVPPNVVRARLVIFAPSIVDARLWVE